ncbi:MAG: hypothetical protein Kow0069_06640 [Promethearchaeota archaeon]
MQESLRTQLERHERKEFKPEDFLRCVAGLKALEVEIFKVVLADYWEWRRKGGDPDEYLGLSVREIARATGRDRTTVQRCVKELRELKFLRKKDGRPKGKRGSRGGLLHLYAPTSLQELKARMRADLDAWYAVMKQYLERFVEAVDETIEKEAGGN